MQDGRKAVWSINTVKEFQVLLFNANNFIEDYSFIYTQLNGSMYSIQIVLFAYS